MIPVVVSESVALVTIPRYAEKSAESALHFSDMRRHRSSVIFQPALAPVRFADTLILYGRDSTRKRYVSRTFYEPRVRPCRFGETDFVFSKDTTRRFASFLDFHIDECRKWFKTCLELKAKTFTVHHAVPSSSVSVTSSGSRRDVTVGDVGSSDGPGASQVFIPPYNGTGAADLAERKFRIGLKKQKDEVDHNMNGPLINGL